ncbi:MAG: helix-hairpin-helix domain-containing protein [Synergistaceae bacterium]|jgi:competence protein ComEA|nr:helix-hairpin-helix domain-containing protein [Synergistaceae bacterium]
MLEKFWKEHRREVFLAAGVMFFFAVGFLARSNFTPFPPPSRAKTVRAEAAPRRAEEPTTETSPASSARFEEPTPWLLYITGAIRAPGTYALPAGARLVHLVERAGGLNNLADVAAMNLAAVLEDGLHVHIPEKSEPGGKPSDEGKPLARSALPEKGEPAISPPAPSAVRGTGAAKKMSALIDVNRASKEELVSLRGIGPVLAESILEYRRKNGPFRGVEDLLRIRGIGEKRLEALRGFVTVGP